MEKEIKAKWPEISEFIKREYRITDAIYRTWFTNLSVFSVDEKNNIITLSYDDEKSGADAANLGIDYIKNRYILFIQSGFSVFFNNNGKDFDIKFILKSQAEITKKAEPPKNDSYTFLNSNYTFDTFVVGTNNTFAHSAALGVSENLGNFYNPLFIYGGAGLGKTHLMNAIANHALELNPSLKIVYVTSEKFTNELIQAIRNRTTQDFRDKYRSIDMLIIDDIQFISGKEGIQEEFFHTFNTLYEAKKQIILSSDKPPKDIKTLEERLRSRLEWGLIADIQSPDYETRMAILTQKIEAKNLNNISNEILNFIASNIKTNVRELEGCLTKLEALSKLKKKDITMDLAEEAIQDFINDDTEKIISLEYIVDIVADHSGLMPQQIYSKNRSAKIAYARQIVMYLCRNYTQLSLTEIGEKLGGRDHATIIHGIKIIEE
ncbi:MAG: chromosomal replication initiator protein DnaA, partial [Lachnospiraceae bacterium]|nr:chromosomal replication initiator protein DnaA [Lachnospiraceae bacterium]